MQFSRESNWIQFFKKVSRDTQRTKTILYDFFKLNALNILFHKMNFITKHREWLLKWRLHLYSSWVIEKMAVNIESSCLISFLLILLFLCSDLDINSLSLLSFTYLFFPLGHVTSDGQKLPKILWAKMAPVSIKSHLPWMHPDSSKGYQQNICARTLSNFSLILKINGILY